jgi:aldehyde dehydrogenase (NAD+)
METSVQAILAQDLFNKGVYSTRVGERLLKATDAPQLKCSTPIDDTYLGTIHFASIDQYNELVAASQLAFEKWRKVPAPKRGEVVRCIGDAFRNNKERLAQLVTLETGKIYQEGLGEIQEVIDICDYAVGLSRQLYGLTFPSERSAHRIQEQYHPLGPVGVITAFNFPAAVWAWNAMLALVCGDTVIWKPSEKASFTAIACYEVVVDTLKQLSIDTSIVGLILGGAQIGEWIANDKNIPLVSATGSVRMGKKVGQAVAQRLGKSLLELGGNNAVIISEHADLKMALKAVVFGAVGTCGQRCTSTRRVIVHESLKAGFLEKLIQTYKSITIGNPLSSQTLVGPLVDEAAVLQYQKAIDTALNQGAKLLYGGQLVNHLGKCYVTPTIIELDAMIPQAYEEVFAPILYVIKYKDLTTEAIRHNNEVSQGLSSSIFTQNQQEAEIFLSSWGSDCGIANINIGTSGAEIGGAFGGEKETGGGRESGTDSWKAYMRRQTNTINFGNDLPLAQGIVFDF